MASQGGSRTYSVCIRVNCDKPGKVPESSEALHKGALITNREKLRVSFTSREERILIYMHKGALVTFRGKEECYSYTGRSYSHRGALFTIREGLYSQMC